MKRILLFLYTIILLIVITSCRETPENTSVVEKTNVINKIEELKLETEDMSYDAPNEWKENLETIDEKISIEINARIKFPINTGFSVSAIEPMDIDQELANKLIEVLFQGNEIYKPNYEISKSEIEEKILSIQESINNPSSDFNEIYELGTEAYTLILDSKMNEIEYLRQKYNTAPDVSVKEIASRNFSSPNMRFELEGETNTEGMSQEQIDDIFRQNEIDSNYFNSLNIIEGVTDLGKNQMAQISITKSENTGECIVEYMNLNEYEIVLMPSDILFCSNDTSEKFNTIRNVKLSKEEAIKLANNTINNIGVQDMELSSICISNISIPRTNISESPQCYTLFYTRSIDDFNSSFESTRISNSNALSAPLAYECIVICIDDTGILKFEWISPSKLVKTEYENVKLLPFNDVKSIVQNQLSYKGKWGVDTFDETFVKKRFINIDQIELSLMRIKKADSQNEWLMIPVWDFYGESTVTYLDNIEIGVPLDDENKLNGRMFRHSYLTINAIDGSIIDRSLGY